MTLLIDDENRVRTLTLNRPEALNAFNEALYDATAQALLDAAEDPEVAVVLLTGAGRGFSAGTDLAEMQARITDPDFTAGKVRLPRTDRGAQRVSQAADLCRERRRIGHRRHHPRLCRPGLHVVDRAPEMPVHQPGRGARSGFVLPAAAAGGPAERRLAVDVLGMGRRRRRRCGWAWSGGSANPRSC